MDRDPRFGPYSIVAAGAVEAGLMTFDQAKDRTIKHLEVLITKPMPDTRRVTLLAELARIRNI